MVPHWILGPEQRPIFIAESGDPLTKYGLDTAWQKMITAAMADGVIGQTERFSLHGLKHRGIIDTPGQRADRQQGSGRKDESMLDTYDYERRRTSHENARIFGSQQFQQETEKLSS